MLCLVRWLGIDGSALGIGIYGIPAVPVSTAGIYGTPPRYLRLVSTVALCYSKGLRGLLGPLL